MVQFTPRSINFLKSNLSIGEGTSPQDESESNFQVIPDHLFQILIFEENSEHPKLIYGTKQNLQDMLVHPNSSDSTLFPSIGTSLDEDFLSDIPGEFRDAQRSTARFLKQARELSQRMAATWLNEEKIPTDEDKIKIKLARKILNSYNLPLDTYFVNDEGTLNNNPSGLEQLIMTAQVGNQDLYLIKREYVSYSSISLSLLLCGQAYYKNGNEWTRIWEPIFSNYEMVYEYALDLSWDTYYATRKDIAQPGINQNPPYTEVTLGYPPKPPEFNLTQEDIQRWVRAKEMPLTGEEDSEFPFYPPKENGKFVSDQIRFVAPPFPYLPLSTV
ncbi:hypothetical protein F7734_38185 [Scytonema sp. UIC 10036]|uniref:hypothetical protein n=1 Tax=Scytonema sp. UIC 10036 TaxID=2304196 RepID=UPI0012DA103E|nr:hypothetical protein [Scytonema sp. UIC 10036]MUG97830.1 hypothetical protein [Scytonema sp. UIC 10036]